MKSSSVSNFLNPETLFVYSKSDRWPSAFRIAWTDSLRFSLKAVETINELCERMQDSTDAVAAIDLTELAHSGTETWQLATQLAQSKTVLALGDYRFTASRIDMIRLGFVELFTSTAEVPRALRLARKSLTRPSIATASTEQIVDQSVRNLFNG